MTTPTNWPNPERPGVPMFPEQDGAHAIEVPGLEGTDLVYYWHQNGAGWTEYNYQDADDFLADEDMQGWIYKGPVLTPTQITEMLAGERKALKEKSWVYMQDDGENVAGSIEYLLEDSEEYEIAHIGEAADIDDYYAFKDRDGAVHKFATRKEAETAIRNLGDAP